MCGRAALSTPPDDLREIFGLDETPELVPRYNIAPTQPIPILRAPRGHVQHPRKIELVRWGLVPWWTHDPKKNPPMINARAEALGGKAAYREAFAKRRCLVIVDAFYEWQREGKRAQPYVIQRPDKKPFALAGFWDKWVPAGAEPVESATVVTVPSQAGITRLHDRMPLILRPEDYDAWIFGDDAAAALAHARQEARADDLVLRAVSSRVNSAANDDAQCMDPPEQPKLLD
jgi:putative SOS response-associated peptidase YedK